MRTAMKVWNGVRNLHIEKKRSFRLLLAAEAFLLLIGILGLFGKNKVYEYGAEAMRGNFGIYDEAAGGYAVVQTDGKSGNLVDFCDIRLPRGAYRVQLHYETDTDLKNRCTVTDGLAGYRALRTNGEHLYAGLEKTDFVMWLSQASDGMIVHAEYAGEGSLLVTGLTIMQTNALNRMFLFWVVLAAAACNGIYIWRQYDKKYGISVKEKNVVFGLALITLFASVPLMKDYMMSGGDHGYHLQRIEGIRESLLNGMFPARNAPQWQQGYGYASAIFYGETLLYLAAFFRLIGFTVTTSYRMFFFVLTVAQVLIAYFSFSRIFREKYVGLLCSMLYTLSIYRIYKIYGCGSFGEGFGVLFLPLLAYGFYRVFATEPTDGEGIRAYRKSWVPLTVGFCGLIQSHLLTCEIVGLFTILLCVVEIKKVFRKETFLVLAKTVIYSILLSAWFLVPFADYMLTGDFVIQHVSGRTIQSVGLLPAQLLFVFSRTGGDGNAEVGGMYDAAPQNLGVGLIVVLGLWLLLCFFGRNREQNRTLRRLGWITAAFAMTAMLFSLSVFPWDAIQSLNPVAATLVSSLQFPNRWLTIATVCLVTLAGVVADFLLRQDGRGFAFYFSSMTVCVALSGLFLLTDLDYNALAVRVYNNEGMGTGYISGAEYLPYGADASKFSHREPIADSGLVTGAYEKKGLTVRLACSNPTDGTALVHMPLLYYKGFVSFDADSGQRLETFADKDFFVTVKIPAGYDGIVQTCFRSPWYWRLAEAVSALSFILLIAAGARSGKGGSRR